MRALEWLLDSDPAIRWQTLRDLTDAPAREIAAERSRVAREGWGARLLADQQSHGGWGEATYKRLLETPDGSATYMLLLLRSMGIDPESGEVRRAIARIRDDVTHYEGRKPFFEGETEPCINGRVLGIGAYFGEPDPALLDRLLSEQLSDGGWNCEAPKSACSSFHSTICVLEGLLECERARGATPRTTEARARGEEYLLRRRMFRSLRTGEVIDPAWTEFSFPFHFRYDVLRGLDYLRDANVRPDERVQEALDLVERKRTPEGRWILETARTDWLPFDFGEQVGQPSRWNTLRALRVLRWAERA